MKRRPMPPWRFLWSHPAHLIACGFGSGLSPWVSGTTGTLGGWALYWLLRPWFSLESFVYFAVASYLLGIWAAHKTGVDLGEADHGAIVWDEIVPFWLLLAFTPDTLLWQSVAFVLFRIFDIVKPFPANYFDNHVKNGFGVMTDDVFAALYAWLTLQIALHYMV